MGVKIYCQLVGFFLKYLPQGYRINCCLACTTQLIFNLFRVMGVRIWNPWKGESWWLMTKLKTKLTPLQNFKISFNKNIYKNIKPNNNTIIKNLTILPTIHLKYINHYFILKQKKLKTNIKNNNTIIKNLTILPTTHLKYINHYFILKQKKLKTNIKPNNKKNSWYIPVIKT